MDIPEETGGAPRSLLLDGLGCVVHASKAVCRGDWLRGVTSVVAAIWGAFAAVLLVAVAGVQEADGHRTAASAVCASALVSCVIWIGWSVAGSPVTQGSTRALSQALLGTVLLGIILLGVFTLHPFSLFHHAAAVALVAASLSFGTFADVAFIISAVITFYDTFHRHTSATPSGDAVASSGFVLAERLIFLLVVAVGIAARPPCPRPCEDSYVPPSPVRVDGSQSALGAAEDIVNHITSLVISNNCEGAMRYLEAQPGFVLGGPLMSLVTLIEIMDSRLPDFDVRSTLENSPTSGLRGLGLGIEIGPPPVEEFQTGSSTSPSTRAPSIVVRSNTFRTRGSWCSALEQDLSREDSSTPPARPTPLADYDCFKTKVNNLCVVEEGSASLPLPSPSLGVPRSPVSLVGGQRPSLSTGKRSEVRRSVTFSTTENVAPRQSITPSCAMRCGTALLIEVYTTTTLQECQNKELHSGPLVQCLIQAIQDIMTTVHDFGGTVAEVRATQVLATWNTFRTTDTCHSKSACGCSLTLQSLVPSLSGVDWVSCCIATGTITSFIISGVSRMHAVFGMPIDQVRSMSPLALTMRCPVMVSEATHILVSALYSMRKVDVIPQISSSAALQPTHAEAVTVWDLNPDGRDTEELRCVFNDAFDLFASGQYEAAAAALQQYIRTKGKDDIQARRLEKLAMGALSGEAGSRIVLPVPYFREMVGWRDFENMAVFGDVRTDTGSSISSSSPSASPALTDEFEAEGLT